MKTVFDLHQILKNPEQFKNGPKLRFFFRNQINSITMMLAGCGVALLTTKLALKLAC